MTSFVGTLKKVIAACTLRPDSFMYVIGLRKMSCSSSISPLAYSPENFSRNASAFARRASSSIAMKPTLCRCDAYSLPGFPRPTSSNMKHPRGDLREAASKNKRRRGVLARMPRLEDRGEVGLLLLVGL